MVRRQGIAPGHAHIARDALFQIPHSLIRRLRLEPRGFPARRKQSPVKYGDFHIHRGALILGGNGLRRQLTDVRDKAAHAGQAHGGIGEVMLGALEPVSRFSLQPHARQFRPLLECLRYEVGGIGGWTGRKRFLVQLVRLLLIETQRARQLREPLRHAVLRADQQ
jgi:hypothetical protein